MNFSPIIFELQWKKKPGFAQIGIILETTDEFLDFQKFKSYLAQNLGTLDDINVSYIDNDGDEIPIESECEFKEALKFARYQAQIKENVILRIETKCKHLNKTFPTDKDKNDLKQQMISNSARFLKSKGCQDVSSRFNFGKMRSLKNQCNKSTNEERKSSIRTKDMEDKIPYWFEKYMDQMKNEIIQEVTENVLKNTRKKIEEMNPQPKVYHTSRKKRQEQEHTEYSNTKDHKLFKKIEKLHKREKKLEKKLDLKLEKLENKTKKLLEKKNFSRQISSSLMYSKNQINVQVLNLQTAPIYITMTDRYCHTLNILNTGTIPFTDVELRSVEKTDDLKIENAKIKCPPLLPGEQGDIEITFLFPNHPGKFDSIWFFFSNSFILGPPIAISITMKDIPDSQLISSNKDFTFKIAENKDVKCSNYNLHCLEEIELEKSSEILNDKMETSTHLKAISLESESEDDNISIISGTITLSDSDNENNFVFIPMTACSTSELPSTSGANNLRNNKAISNAKENKKTFESNLIDKQIEDSSLVTNKLNNTIYLEEELQFNNETFSNDSGIDPQLNSNSLQFEKFQKNDQMILAIDDKGLCHHLNALSFETENEVTCTSPDYKEWCPIDENGFDSENENTFPNLRSSFSDEERPSIPYSHKTSNLSSSHSNLNGKITSKKSL